MAEYTTDSIEWLRRCISEEFAEFNVEHIGGAILLYSRIPEQRARMPARESVPLEDDWAFWLN